VLHKLFCICNRLRDVITHTCKYTLVAMRYTQNTLWHDNDTIKFYFYM